MPSVKVCRSILSNDVFMEILLRTDPSCIFKCILVCKEWYKIITEAAFRQKYLKTWAGHPELLVGFLTYPHFPGCPCWYFDDRHRPVVRLLPTCKLGRRIIEERDSLHQAGYFISFADGLLLSGTLPSTFYTFKPFTDGLLTELPPPPVKYENVAVAIITQDPNSFKVIIARITPLWEKTLNIQTFSSSTGMWEHSLIPCLNDFVVKLSGEPGFVSSRGVVYLQLECWGLAAYDTKNQHINFIPEEMYETEFVVCDRMFAHYGVSPQGSIWCAKHIQYERDSWDLGVIKLWVLDEDEKSWNLMHDVELKPIWIKHSAVLDPFFGGRRPSKPFTFVSFVPGTTDCFYVELKGILFLYHLHTQELDIVGAGGDYNYFRDAFKEVTCLRRRITRNLPLTLAELGIWPGSSMVVNLY